MANITKLNGNDKKSIKSKYLKGATGRELAAEFGVSISTIFNALRDMEVTIRPRGRQAAND